MCVCVRVPSPILVHDDTCMCAHVCQDARKPTDHLASTLTLKDDNQIHDHLEKFMKTGSIATWVLLQVYQIVGGGRVS